MSTYVLGISAFFHDSAACLLRDGKIVAAAHEERFSRIKHDSAFPKQAIEFCLVEAGITMKDVEFVAFYEKPIVKFDRILQTSIYSSPLGLVPFLKAMPVWLKDHLWMYSTLKRELSGFEGKIIFPSHHESHAASAFFASPFKSAAVLTIDAVGEWNTVTYGVGKNNELKLQKAINFPHSLGMLYSAFTYYCGFKVNSGEYKLMGLAPYGEPKYASLIKQELVDIKEDGSFRLNTKYFGYLRGMYMINNNFVNLFENPVRKPEGELTQFYMDVAASIQVVTEEIVLKIVNYIQKDSNEKNLCLAGGVALNCVANGRVEKNSNFSSVWIQPASGDAGGALGAALFVWYQHLKKNREANGVTDFMSGSYLGPSFSDEQIESVLQDKRATYKKCSDSNLIEQVAELLNQGKVVGWFQGRMEYGPRALGARSILGDARNVEMQKVMNVKIKFRESFRPFAPSVLEENVEEYFEGATKSPYMLKTYPLAKAHRKSVSDETVSGIAKLKQLRSTIPAVTHVDYSARVQTVSKETNPKYHALISKFSNITGCPVIVNTSFNVRGEPIVCTPEDAWNCFINTNIDFLAIGNFIVEKKDIKSNHEMDEWVNKFEAD